jgi:hypothetical protein
VAAVKNNELKLIQEEEERSMGSKLALKWAIQPRRSKLYWCASSDRLSPTLEYVCILRYFRLAFVMLGQHLVSASVGEILAS